MGLDDQKTIEERYRVFPRTLCFITRDDSVLLLRGASDKRLWPNLYNGVGGHVEPDEDIHTAALREIYEETGLHISSLQLRGVINIPTAKRNIGIVVFVFTAAADTWTVRSSEEGSLEWVPLNRVMELHLVEDLSTLLHRVLVAHADTHSDEVTAPFFARYYYDDEDRLQVTFANEAKRFPND